MSTELVLLTEINLTPEEYETIENLAGINYSPREIAIYLSQDVSLFMHHFVNPDSKIHYHYARGVLIAGFEVDNKLLENAKSGNITATQEYKKAAEKRRFDNHKQRILNEG